MNSILKTITSLPTTSGPEGVATRYITVMLGTVLALVGLFGVLTQEQVDALIELVPGIVSLIGTAIGAWTAIYAIIQKSSSDKAAKAASEIDAKIAKGDKVEILVPGDAPNIIVPGNK